MKTRKIISLILCFIMIVFAFSSCKKAEEETEETSDISDSTDFASAICMQSEHYTVDAGMFSFFFYKDYFDAMETYYSTYYSGAGLDYTKDLKEQDYSDDATWFDYFITMTYQNVGNYLVYAELANDEGTTLGDEDLKAIDEEFESLVSAAEEADMTCDEYIKYCFGEDVTEENVKSALELQTLADKQYDIDCDGISVSDKEIEDYYNENKDSFLYVDYRQVQVRAEFEVDAKDDAEAYAIAKEKAEYIASSKDIAEYVERSVEYLKTVNDPNINKQISEKQTDEEIMAQMTNVTVKYAYTTNTEFGKWAFAEGRKDGDMTVLDNGAGIYTAYYLDSAPYRAENNTINARFATFNPDNYESDEEAKQAAENALTAFNKTSKTGEDFAQIAVEYSVSSSGSLQKNIDLGSLSTYLEAWAFGERSEGDCEIVEDSGVYYLCYFEGKDMQSWEYTAYSAVYSEKLSDLASEHYENYSFNYNLNNMNLLSGITPYATQES